MKYLPLLLALLMAACNYTQRITDGRTAYERKQYAVAAEMLSKEFNRSSSTGDKGRIAYLVAESYRRMNNNADALSWYRQAYNNGYGVEALIKSAYALQETQQYRESTEAFRSARSEMGSPYAFRKEIAANVRAQQWLDAAEENLYEVSTLDVNSGNADYAPALYGERQLVFTSDREGSEGKRDYKWTGNAFSDLYVVDADGGAVSAFDEGLNTPWNEGTATFYNNDTEVIFSRCGSDERFKDGFCKLMHARKSGSGWSTPEPLSFVREGVNYAHPSVSADGKQLYFAAKAPGGVGEHDVYTAVQIEGSRWQVPTILSRSINTQQDDMFPHIDGDTLYFASAGHGGMGGLDIFYSIRNESGKFGRAINLEAPINSGSDDFGFIVDRRAAMLEGYVKAGYFSSTRDGGKGNDDIYRYMQRVPPPPPPVDTTVEQEPIVYTFYLDGVVLENVRRDANDPNSTIIGSRAIPEATVQVQLLSRDTSFTLTTGEDGTFSFELEREQDYAFFASKPGYFSNRVRFSSRDLIEDPDQPEQRYSVEIRLQKIYENQEIVLQNIYYDYDSAEIREDAKPTLRSLAGLLERNPSVRIELASHTDCRGSNSYNQDLSQRRAQSAVDFLVQQGIGVERLTAIGYGESIPTNTCVCAQCTEAEHQQNRRTTFKVTEVE